MPDVPLQRLVDRYYEVYGEGLLIVDSDGRTLAARGLSDSDPGVATAGEPRPRRRTGVAVGPILPWERRTGPGHRGCPARRRAGGRRRRWRSTPRSPRREVARSLAVGGGRLSGVCSSLAALVARALTRWVLRPLDGLERAVAEMTEGIAGPPADVAGPPELRHFTSAFNTMAQVVRASLDRQRRLVADASHQLRNPLGRRAVCARTPSTTTSPRRAGPTYGSMTAELDRLENLLQQLLRLARAEEVSGSRKVGLSAAAAESTDLDDVVDERMAFWQPVADGQHQQLRYRSAYPGLAVQLARHDVEQLLDVALDNALRYAGPDTTVTVSTGDRDATVELVVSDDGPGLPDEDLSRAVSTILAGAETTAPERASGWRSRPRSPRATAGRSRWSGPRRAASWSATACQSASASRHADATDRPS